MNYVLLDFLKKTLLTEIAKNPGKKRVTVKPGKSNKIDDFDEREGSGITNTRKGPKNTMKVRNCSDDECELGLQNGYVDSEAEKDFRNQLKKYEEEEMLINVYGDIEIGNYILLKISTKKTLKYCVGNVIEK